MKTILTGTIVGAIIMFGWQALSWTALGIHDDSFRFTPGQDSIITYLENKIPQQGVYMIPNKKPGASEEEAEMLRKKMQGKPWAIVTYHDNNKMDMVSPMLRGFLSCFFCVLLACITISRFQQTRFAGVFFTALSFGLVSFLFVSYSGYNWFQTPWHYVQGELIDALAGWSLCGIWLGLWYNRKQKKNY